MRNKKKKLSVQQSASKAKVRKVLHTSEERFRVFFEASPDAYFVNDLEGNLVDCNQAAEQLLGWKRDEILNKNFVAYKIYPDEELPRVQKLLLDIVSGRQQDIVPHTFTMLRRDGKCINVELFGHIVSIGKIKYLYVVARDVTQRILSEQQLKESEFRYQALVSHLPDAIYIYDDGKYIYSNEAGIKLLGLNNIVQLLGVDIMNYVHPDYKDMIRQRWANIEKSHEPAQLVEQKLVRHDGQVIDIDVRSIPFPYNKKNMILAIVRDISARKTIETALVKSEEALRTFIEQSVEGIIIVGEDGRIIGWNSAMTAIGGLVREQAIGKYFWEIHMQMLPDAKRDQWPLHHMRGMIQKFLQTGKVDEKYMVGEVQMIGHDGTTHCIQLKIFAICTTLGFRLGVIAQDITSQKEMEKRVLEVSDQVQRQIGHDLHDGVNQLLMALKLRLSVLQDDLSNKDKAASEEAGRLYGMIKMAMDQMISMTQGLSPISIEHGGLAVALKELAHSTETIFNIKCTEAMDDIELPDLATATHLYRIVQEAVNNAVKHGEAKNIDIKLEKVQYGIRLVISDDGLGFITKVHEGNGMGMAIMQYRANLIGASLSFSKNKPTGIIVACSYKLE